MRKVVTGFLALCGFAHYSFRSVPIHFEAYFFYHGAIGAIMSKVKDIMTEEVFVVKPHAKIDEAISLLLDHRVSGLPVVDDDFQLLGVITEFDIIDLVYQADIEESIVADYMTKEVSFLDVESSLDDAANIFCNNSIRRVPIVQEGRLVGVLSRHDLINFVREVRRSTAGV